jgi:hypothetical protein
MRWRASMRWRKPSTPRVQQMPDLKINPRQWVAAGFHVISKITKGFRSRAAEPADTGLKIFAYHGDDLVSIAHKHNIFRGLLNKSRLWRLGELNYHSRFYRLLVSQNQLVLRETAAVANMRNFS